MTGDIVGQVDADVGIVGVPFDSGVSYRPGARFGPRMYGRARSCCGPSIPHRVSSLSPRTHLDTWDSYFGAAYAHGTPFRPAGAEGPIDMGYELLSVLTANS